MPCEVHPVALETGTQLVDLHRFPAVRDRYLGIAERPAVRRGYHVPQAVGEIPMP